MLPYTVYTELDWCGVLRNYLTCVAYAIVKYTPIGI